MNKIIINLHGPMAAGKSTLTEMLREKYTDFAYVDRPFIKRGLKPAGNTLAKSISKDATYFIIKEIIKNNVNIIVQEVNPQSIQNQLGEIINKNNYVVLSFYLKCGLEESIKRDEKRFTKKGRPELVREIYEKYKEPTELDIVIDTENNSKEECVELILGEIGKIK